MARPRYVLDTNVVSTLVRRPDGCLARRERAPARRLRGPAGLALGAALVCVASPSPGYRFYVHADAWNLLEIASSARAVRWERDAFPLRFRILDTGHLPDYAGLDDDKWREIVRRGFAAWDAIETAEISIVVEEEALVADQSDVSDGINTIGFEVREERGEYRAYASLVEEHGRMTGCDIHFGPTVFDDWPKDDPRVAEWAAHFLEEVVVHEMGHCLGLRHVPANPVWLGQRANSPNWPPGFLPEPLAGLSPDPQMSIAASYGVPRLMPDDGIGVSLLYPAPGFFKERGSIAGRIAFPDGGPAAFAYVQAVDYATGEAAFGPGAFADEDGQFQLEGLPAGPVHIWVRPTRYFADRPRYQDTGTAEMLDEHRWFAVRSGVVTVVPEIMVQPGRNPP